MNGAPDYFEDDYLDIEYYSDLDGDGEYDYNDYDREGDGFIGESNNSTMW